jgi:hypothetical protein
MASPAIQSHRAKTQNLLELCKFSATLGDLRIQAYLSKYLIIMASAYIELSVKEVLGLFCDSRSHPAIKEFVESTISWENSLNCRKIEEILGRFDKSVWSQLQTELDVEALSSIDSLKTLRDQVAHGKDNGTGYVVISRYFGAILDFSEKLLSVMNRL